jgi:hypothetical protein
MPAAVGKLIFLVAVGMEKQVYIPGNKTPGVSGHVTSTAAQPSPGVQRVYL